MKIAWLPLLLLVACTTEEPVVDSTATDPGSTSTDTPTTDTPTTDPTTTDPTTTDTPTTGPTTTDDTEASATDVDPTGVDPDSSTGDDGSSSDDGTTGPIPDECDGIEMIELLDPFVTPVDSKSWTPGGSVTVGATMHNPGPDYISYPSIIVESDNPLVTSGMPNNSLFAILEDQSLEIYVTFEADDATLAGTEVTFTIRMASLDNVCPNGDAVEVSAILE